MNYELLSAFILATTLLSISPGPDIMFVLIQSIAHGKRYGLATTAGLMTGCLVHTTLLAIGVSAVIRSSPGMYLFIKIFGALYLFYLAFRAARTPSDIEFTGITVPKKSLWNLYRQGFIMNVMNPKVTIFFLAFFPGFLFNDSWSLILQFYILGAIFIAVSFTIFAAFAILSGTISKYIRSRPQSSRMLKWLQVVVFIGIGVYLLFSEN